MNTPPELYNALIKEQTPPMVLKVVEQFFHSPTGLTMITANSFIDQGFELAVTSGPPCWQCRENHRDHDG